jgi:uncharacterized protein (DUF433 family)
MTQTVHAIDYIVSNPEIRGGRPCIRGTGLRVSDVAAQSIFHGQTPDDISVGFGVSLAAVYAALAYYYDHQDDIRDEWARDEAFFDDMKRRSQVG